MKGIAPALLSICLIVHFPDLALAASDATSTETSEVVRSTVTVESVDVPNRLLTVKNEAGKLQTINVDESVRNFDKLDKGDKISIRFKKAVAAEIKPPGTGIKGVETQENVQRAKPGERPGGVAESTVRATIKVKNVDLKQNTLTFVGPKGVTRTIAVKNPEMRAYLKKLKPGDEVEVAYTEALVVEVDPAR
jgi:Cu/Ag efflux protein CusF